MSESREPQSSNEPLQYAKDRYPMSRRRFLTRATQGLAIAYMTNTAATEALWPPNEPELLPLDYSQNLMRSRRQKEGWIIADGLGHQDALPEATAFAHYALHNQQPMSYFKYSNQGITAESLAPLIADYAKQFEHLSVVGNSLGGIAILEATRQAVVNHGRPIHLRRVVLICSPFNLHDTKQEGIARAVARFNPRGGFTGEVLYNAVGALGHGPYDPFTIGADITSSFDKTLHGIPPSLWTGQLALGANTDLGANWQDFQTHNIITPDTKALFCAPEDLARDGLVYDDRAFHNYKPFFNQFGVTLDYLSVPDAGHADVPLTSRSAEPWIRATM